ncbi:hypothetical protein BaRGS_00023581, partial [Batillaria attramentaria]
SRERTRSRILAVDLQKAPSERSLNQVNGTKQHEFGGGSPRRLSSAKAATTVIQIPASSPLQPNPRQRHITPVVKLQ